MYIEIFLYPIKLSPDPPPPPDTLGGTTPTPPSFLAAPGTCKKSAFLVKFVSGACKYWHFWSNLRLAGFKKAVIHDFGRYWGDTRLNLGVSPRRRAHRTCFSTEASRGGPLFSVPRQPRAADVRKEPVRSQVPLVICVGLGRLEPFSPSLRRP